MPLAGGFAAAAALPLGAAALGMPQSALTIGASGAAR